MSLAILKDSPIELQAPMKAIIARKEPALIKTSRQLRNDGHEMYCGQNIFNISHTKANHFAAILRLIGERRVSMMRHVGLFNRHTRAEISTTCPMPNQADLDRFFKDYAPPIGLPRIPNHAIGICGLRKDAVQFPLHGHICYMLKWVKTEDLEKYGYEIVDDRNGWYVVGPGRR